MLKKEKDLELGRKLSFIIRAQDQKIKKEHAFELNKNNRCPKCFILKTKLGKCSMGCDE